MFMFITFPMDYDFCDENEPLNQFNDLFRNLSFKVDAQYQKTLHANDPNRAEDELKRSAGEILNGVKRTVEVQVVNPSTFNFQDQTILGMFRLDSKALNIGN